MLIVLVCAIQIRNRDHFDTLNLGVVGTSNTGSFVAKYPGELGNALAVSFCPAAGDSAFDLWDYKGAFDQAAGTSPYLTAINDSSTNDEMHVAVVDRTGAISGTKGTVLETFPHVSTLKGASTPDGTPNYISDVINNKSNYIWNGYFGDDSAFGAAHDNFGELIGDVASVDSAQDYGLPFGGWTNAKKALLVWAEEQMVLLSVLANTLLVLICSKTLKLYKLTC